MAIKIITRVNKIRVKKFVIMHECRYVDVSYAYI